MAGIEYARVRRLTVAAVSAAVIFLITWMIKVPLPVSGGAYLNFGDSAIYICAFILGGPGAALSAGVGSALADLVSGAPLYVAPTLLIKSAMGLLVGLMTSSQKFWTYAVACVLGGAIMIAGYAAFEAALFGTSMAVATLPFNLVQMIGSVLAAIALFHGARRLSNALGLRKVREYTVRAAHN